MAVSPRRMFCLVVPAVGTIARNSRIDNWLYGDPAEKIFLVICQFCHVITGGAHGDHQWQQVFLAWMRSTR